MNVVCSKANVHSTFKRSPTALIGELRMQGLARVVKSNMNGCGVGGDWQFQVGDVLRMCLSRSMRSTRVNPHGHDVVTKGDDIAAG